MPLPSYAAEFNRNSGQPLRFCEMVRSAQVIIDYEAIFERSLKNVRSQRRYRVFADIERIAGRAPYAVWHSRQRRARSGGTTTGSPLRYAGWPRKNHKASSYRQRNAWHRLLRVCFTQARGRYHRRRWFYCGRSSEFRRSPTILKARSAIALVLTGIQMPGNPLCLFASD